MIEWEMILRDVQDETTVNVGRIYSCSIEEDCVQLRIVSPDEEINEVWLAPGEVRKLRDHLSRHIGE